MGHFGSDWGRRWPLLLGGLLLLIATACGGEAPRSGAEGPHFVTTIPPFEMILAPLVEGRGTTERLLAPGASPHTYDPAPSDLRATTRATALVYGAEALDGWAATLPASRRLGLVDLLPPDVQLAFDAPGAEGPPAVDPHFWTDPQAVRRLLPALADTLCAIDAPGCPTYRANADTFAAELAALDAQVRSIVAPVRGTPVFLAQPFFRYFLRRYGPRLVGVVEPRPGTEPTPQQLHRLVRRAQASGARAVLTQRSLSARAARAVAEPTALPMVALDPLGGAAGRATYAELLRANARILRDSLAAAPEASGSARRPGR
jgi:zinc transport system substrate-binding protein